MRDRPIHVMIVDDEESLRAPLSEWLEEAQQAACQARDLTQQLLTFSKGGAPVKETASVAELIEQETRIALRRCENSFAKIKFTRQAAEAAANNLGIVQDKYTEGIVDVTELISAQNQKLTADQFAAAAVYDFLINLVELQRAISWFEDDKTADEQNQFVEQITSAVEN